MHEMGIAVSILEGVEAELLRRPGSRARKVGVRIGALAGVDPDALSFAFEALTLDTEFAGLALDVEYVAPRSRCRECSQEFEIRNYELLCPACGSLNTERLSGDELAFTYLELDDSDPEASNPVESQRKTGETGVAARPSTKQQDGEMGVLACPTQNLPTDELEVNEP